MAFPRDIAEHDQPVETNVEAEIHEFARPDVVASPGSQTESDNHLVASNINSVLQGATATSVQEIEKLISELQALRDMLHSEAARVQHEIVQYSNLTQAALQSTKTITESLEEERFRRADDIRLTICPVRQQSGPHNRRSMMQPSLQAIGFCDEGRRSPTLASRRSDHVNYSGVVLVNGGTHDT